VVNFRAHGTPSAYNKGCRCDTCSEANREYRKQARAKMLASGNTPHGTVSGYRNWGCRCDLCKTAVKPDSREKYLRAKSRKNETGQEVSV
jgi:hypothetical protein